MPGHQVASGIPRANEGVAEQLLWWQPGGGQKHATRASGCRDREVFSALCGRDVATDNGDIAWFFSTCPACYVVANDRPEGRDD